MPPRKQHQWNQVDGLVEDDRPSRSQKKRDSTALQKMGEELAALGPAALAKMPLTPNIMVSIREWQKLSSHEGRRRQMQYIGRLMREEGDAAAIREALDSYKQGLSGATAAFKHCEQLRDALLAAETEDAARALLGDFSEEATAELLELIAQARNEREHKRPPHAFRALFRKLQNLQ